MISLFYVLNVYFQKEIVEPRVAAMKSGRIIREREPIGIRRKDFWDVPTTAALLEPKFTKKLGHEPDGLVFQPIEEVTFFYGNKLLFFKF